MEHTDSLIVPPAASIRSVRISYIYALPARKSYAGVVAQTEI